MIDDILSPAFLQAACAKKAAELLTFKSSSDDPSIEKLSCVGDIVIESIKDGKPVTATYSDLNMQRVEISADVDTTITIHGKVTVLDFLWYNADPDVDDYEGDFYDLTVIDLTQATSLAELTVAQQGSLEELILSGNKKLTKLDCSGCTGLTSLDLAANTQLQTLYCGNITNLTSLDLAANTQLQTLYCSGCTGLTDISYPATNEDVSTVIANAITAATAADGTVTTDSAGAYYSTIETAATAKGWTIEQIQE